MTRLIIPILIVLVSGQAWAGAPPTIESLLEINPRIYTEGSVGMTTLDTGVSNLTGTAKLDEEQN